MSFYGNIANSIKTTLKFDIKYSSRFEMDNLKDNDGIMPNRYVLVEYGIFENSGGLTSDVIVESYWNNSTGQLYSDSSYSNPIIGEEGKIYKALIGDSTNNNVSEKYYHYFHYKDNKFIKIVDNTNSNYVGNFNIDRAIYGEGRGYDSTVWQKYYDDQGNDQYVQIADLNSAAPTFKIAVEAPTEVPIAPHFSDDSTNTLYTLHLQPQWGFKIGDSPYSDLGNGKAIYYNKNGFNKKFRNYDNVNENKDYVGLQKISSGRNYITTDHMGTAQAADIYEFKMILPAIGNAICEFWDMIYGENRKGLELPEADWILLQSGKKDYDLSSVVGTLNRYQDILGKIIVDYQDLDINNISQSELIEYKDNIIKNGEKHYRVHKYNTLIPITADNKDEDSIITSKWFINNTPPGQILPSLDLYNSRIFPEPSGKALVCLDPDNYTYALVEIERFGEGVTTLHGSILKVMECLGQGLPEDTRDIGTIKGVVNCISDIIDIFGGLGSNRILGTDDQGSLMGIEIKGDNWISFEDLTLKHKTLDSMPNFSGGNGKIITGITVDNAGHLTGISFDESLSATYGGISTEDGNVTSDSMGSSIILNGDKKYIETKVSEGKVIIAHKEPTIVKAVDSNSLSENAVNFNTVSELKVDDGGHVCNYTTTTFTMPSSFQQYNLSLRENSYEQVNLSKYIPKYYYYEDGVEENGDSKYVIDNSDNITGGRVYYIKTLYEVTEDHEFIYKYFETKLDTYEKDTYFYQDENGEYTLDDSEYITGGRIYYKYIYPGDDIGKDNSLSPIQASNDLKTLDIELGNRWLDGKIYNNKLILGHKLFHVDDILINNVNQNEFYGKNIVLPNFQIDRAGHVLSASQSQLIVPPFLKINEEDAGEGKFLADLEIQNTGNYKGVYKDILQTKLSSYTSLDNPLENGITTETVLIDAISHLELKIKLLEEEINKLKSNTETE